MTVSDSDTALALRSGTVAVLGTPRLVALCEEATVAALKERLEPQSCSVGVQVQMEHVSPTPVGATVTAEAHLDKIEGRRLRFSVSARDERGLVAAGKVTRVIVSVDDFMSKTS